MVNVLIIGATAYIGQALSQSLIRAGDHRVFGLARSPEKAKALESQQVIPIIGTISKNPELLKAINAKHINIVVDVACAYQESYDLLALVGEVGANRLTAAKDAGVRIPKLGFIYCSGTWTYGSLHEPVNDLMLTSSCRWSGFFEPLYIAAQNGAESVTLPAELGSRPGLVHVDDVASGFHTAIDKLPLISGTGVYPLFDLVTSEESMEVILTSAAREFGFKGKLELAGPGDDLFAKAMCTSMNASSGRAKPILGWEPRRYGFCARGGCVC